MRPQAGVRTVSLMGEVIRIRVDMRVAWIVKVLLGGGIPCYEISPIERLGVVGVMFRLRGRRFMESSSWVALEYSSSV
jgi:hypothetical protein